MPDSDGSTTALLGVLAVVILVAANGFSSSRRSSRWSPFAAAAWRSWSRPAA